MENIFNKLLILVSSVWMTVFGLNAVAPIIKNTDIQTSITAQVATTTGVEEKIGNFWTQTRQLIATPTEVKTVTQTVTLDKNIVGDKVYSNDELLAMSGPKLATLPLGDNKYSTIGAKVGYIYLCHVGPSNGQGAGTDGPWIKGTTWTPSEKAHVEGSVSWPSAWFKNVVSGVKRLITGNNLPIDHTTGTFPISASSEAGKYDRNPNGIKTQNLSYTLSASPTYSDTPTCMGGEVGVMLSGVPLFNGFDAQERDAQAHEVQDSCDGHPQEKGEYHYHGLSSCFSDTSVTKVLGYALDGFPITGGKIADNKYLTTDDLDICHGLTSEVVVDGKKTTTYHYVMTQDFPYSAGCFRGTPIKVGNNDGGQQVDGGGATVQGGQAGGVPPQPALDACTGKTSGNTCTVQTPNGSLSGTCNYTPDKKYFACIPTNR